MPDIWGVLSIFVKFSLYISVLTAAGTVLVVPIFRLKHAKHLTVKVTVVAIVASLSLYGLDAIALTGDLSGLIDLEILSLLFKTSSGQAFYIRLAGLALLLLGLSLSHSNIGKWISVIGALVSLYSFMRVGHMHDQDSLIISLSLYVHLLAASLWIGILHPLRNMALHEQDISITADLAHRFGQLAILFVPILLLAGGYMTWVSFDSLIDLVTTGYGQTLLVKIASVSILLLFAAYNRLKFVPQLRQGNISAARNLAKTINAEWTVIAVILIATAVLTTASDLP